MKFQILEIKINSIKGIKLEYLEIRNRKNLTKKLLKITLKYLFLTIIKK